MGRTIGLISLFLAITVAILFILAIWGVFPFSIWTLGKLGLTLAILFFTFLCILAIYGMFFWKGNERQLPTSSKEKAMMNQHRSDK